MNTTYYRRIANPGGNNYIEAIFDKQVYNNLASSTSTFNVFKLKDSQKQYLEKITVNSSNIDLDNSNYLTIANHTFDSNISAKIYKITKKCLDDKGLASKDIVVRIFINEDINDLYGLFENLGTNYLKKITFNVDTANVTNMGYMFQGASYLTEVEFKKFNSSKVTIFTGMFNNCTSITNLNLVRVSSNSVQLMNSTFEGCSSLETLNISNWNTSNVTNMSKMFNGCSNLKNIQISSNFKVSNVTTMANMFSACSKLNTIGTTENTIDLSNFSGSNGCNCSYMFSAAGDINRNITLNLGSLKVTNCSYMFRGSGFTTVNLNIYNSSSIDTSNMFYIATNKLKTVTFSNTVLKSKKCSNMFYNCKNITTINFNSFDTSACTDMQYMFYSCSSLKTLNINGFKTSNVTNFSNMFAGCTALTKITTNQNNFVLDKSENLSSMFLNCTSLKTLGGTDNIVYIKNTSNINSCTDISYMFESCKAMTSCQLVNFTSTSLTSVGFMLGNCIELTTLNINGLGGNISANSGSVFIFGTKNANTNDVFGAPKLTNLTINNFNLGSLRFFVEGDDYNGETIITDNTLLHNCPKLTTCTFTNWTMKYVETLERFFAPPIGTTSELKTVNLTGLMTSTDLKKLRGMFSGCTELTTIKGLNRNSSSTGSPNLVISGVNDMAYMFNDCSSLTTLDLTGFYVSAACTTTTAMFNHCEKLTKIDLSGWNTSNIKECDSMFSNCYKLTELDLSNWDTSKVENMEKIFYMDRSCVLNLITTGTSFKLKNGIKLSNIFNKEKENIEDCGTQNPGEGIYYYPDLGKIIIDEDSGAESILANVNDPYFSIEIIPGSTNSFKYGKYQYLPNNWQPQIIKRNYILARYDGSLETTFVNGNNFINPDNTNGWDIYVYSKSKIDNYITYDNNLITNIDYKIFDEATPDIVLNNSTDYKDGVYWLKICPNNSTNSQKLNSLFQNCEKITYVDFSTFKFEYNNIKYTSASYCLKNTPNLIQCKMTSKANILADTSSMFAGCTSLIKFDANNFTATSVTNASYMFSGCTSLKDGSQFESLTFNKLNDASYIFSNATNLNNINIEIASTEYIDFYKAFENCISLTTATVKFDKAKDMSRMFYNCSSLTEAYFNDIIEINTGKTSEPNIDDLNNSNTRGYGLISVFRGCINLKAIEFIGGTEINYIDTRGYVSCYAMFYETRALEDCWLYISRYSKDVNDGVLTTQRMFTQSMLDRTSLNKDFKSNYIDCYIESGCLQDTSYMFYQSGITGLTLDIKKLIDYNTTSDLVINNMSYMFAHCDVLSNIVNKRDHIIDDNNKKYENHTFDLSWFKTSDKCNCTGMFEGTSSKLHLYSGKSIEDFNKDLVNNYDNTTMLIDVLLGSINASDCSDMFYHGNYNKYTGLDTGIRPLYIKTINFGNFNTINCTSIENMFRGCIYIKELNLESLNLSSVTNMNYAFYNYIHITNQEGGFNHNYNENTPLHFPENETIKDGQNYIINKLSVIRTYTDFKYNVSCNNLFHKNYEDNYVYTYFDGVFYYKQHASNIGFIIPTTDKNPSIYTPKYANDPEKIYNGDHKYIPNNWMGLPIIESDYFLVYYDKLVITGNQSLFTNINKTIINTNSNNSNNSDIKIFEVPVYNSTLKWGINPEIIRNEFYTGGFSNLVLDSKRFYINSNWKEIDITKTENANDASVYVVLRERSNLSYLFEGCTCNLNIIAGPQTIEISSIKGLFKNCEGLGFRHLNPRYTDSVQYIYGTGNIFEYNLLDKITTSESDCLEELYEGCSNIISETTELSQNNELSQASLDLKYFDFYPIYSCVRWLNNIDSYTITSFANLFNGCSNIRNIVCNYNGNGTLIIKSINDVSYMFNNCSKLTKINKPNNITFSNISNFGHVFENCENLISGADSFFDLKEQPIENALSMFANCKKLVFENNDTQSVGSDWNITASTTNLSNMFYNCYELSGVDMSSWDISNVIDMSRMFYMDKNNGNEVKLSKVNFVSSDSYLPSTNIIIDNLFNKGFDNAYGDKSYIGYLYPYQTTPTTGSFTYVEGNNVKKHFLPDSDINPELANSEWSRHGVHEVIPNNWNASYIISGDDGYVLMVYRPDYTTQNGKITSFSPNTLLMNSDYYSNSGECRSHINYTAITKDKGESSNDDLSQLYSVAATSTYDGSPVSFKTLKAYEYKKSNGTSIYMRNPNLTQTQVDASTTVTDYNLTDLCIPVSSNVSNINVKNIYYVANSIINSRIIAKVKFNEYLRNFCYHNGNIKSGIFDNAEVNNIKLYKIDFSRSKSIWYGNDENNNDFNTYETKREQHNYTIGLADCYRAFYNCNLLKEIKFKDESGTYASDSWGMFTKTFNSTSYMFYGCSSLETLNIKCFNTKNVYQMKYMFYGCSNLKTLEFTQAQTINIGNYQHYIGFDTYNNLFFGYMFGECSSLSELNLKGFYFNENVILKNGQGSSLLGYINQYNLTIEEVKRFVSVEDNGQYLTNMFYNCTNLRYLMLPDISRFLYRMFSISLSEANYIKILIQSLFNTNFVGKNAILYCEFDDLKYEKNSLEKAEWLFGDQGCTGYSEEDGTILDIIFNMLPNNWTIQPSTNKIFINVSFTSYSYPFYVIKYDENIKAINIYNSSNFAKINGEFNIYNNPNEINKQIYNTYYKDSIGIKDIESKYIYLEKNNPSNTQNIIVEIIFKNYFDNYFDNFTTSYLFSCEGSTTYVTFINTIKSENGKKTISVNSNLNKIYLHSFGIRNYTTVIPKFDVKCIFNKCDYLINIFNLDILKYSTNVKSENIFLRTIIDSDATNAFSYCSELEFIDCFNWDTSNVTNMYGMFSRCKKLTKIGSELYTLDFSNWDTSNVINMSHTFEYVYENKLPHVTLNLSNWDTSKVTDMSSMFYVAEVESIIGLKDFITSNVKTLSMTFGFCYINNFNEVEGWDVSNVENMRSFFVGYNNDRDSLQELNLSSWNTSKVTTMDSMFENRGILSSLILFTNTSNVIEMCSMFEGCEALSNIINIENFKTTSCKDMHAMFKSCKSLTELDLSLWNTSKVTNMHQMFYVCESLSNINISGWNTASVTDMHQMFSKCRALTDDKIVHILSNIEFNKATNISYMFEDCDTVENITNYFTGINRDLVNTSGLFTKNSKSLSLSTNIEDIIENAEYIHNMFSGINKLNTNNSDFITFDMSNIKSLGNLFYKTTIDLPICFSGNFNMVLGSDEMIKNADNQTDTSVNGIFGGCTHIGNINNLSTFDISFGTYYVDNEYYADTLFSSIGTNNIFYNKSYLHYFIPTYKDSSSNVVANYDYSYSSTCHFGGLTNIFNNNKQISILLGDCFKTGLNNSFFKVYGSSTGGSRLLICNSENMATNIKNNYGSLVVLYKCIVVNLTLDIPSEYASIDVISEIFTNLLNNPAHKYFDNMNFTSGLSYSNTTGRHIITAVFTFSAINNENPVDYNIFNTSFTDNNNICDCITHIVISNSINYMNTSLPTSTAFNSLEEVTIYFLPISDYKVNYEPGIIKSLEGNSNNININLIYDIENTAITIPTKPNSNTIYNIKCNRNNSVISGYNYYKYITGDLTDY